MHVQGGVLVQCRASTHVLRGCTYPMGTELGLTSSDAPHALGRGVLAGFCEDPRAATARTLIWGERGGRGRVGAPAAALQEVWTWWK